MTFDRPKTTMVDIYEAAGGTASEDRTQVSMTPPLKPFEIVVRVVPVGVEFTSLDADPKVTFAVLLDDTFEFESGFGGHTVHHITHEAEISMPAAQVHILNKETS